MLTLETRQLIVDTPAQKPPAAAHQSPQDQRFLASVARLAPRVAPADPLADPDYRTVVRWIPLVVPGIAVTLLVCALMVLSTA